MNVDSFPHEAAMADPALSPNVIIAIADAVTGDG